MSLENIMYIYWNESENDVTVKLFYFGLFLIGPIGALIVSGKLIILGLTLGFSYLLIQIALGIRIFRKHNKSLNGSKDQQIKLNHVKY